MSNTERSLYLFDCDETLWESEGQDYIGSVPSEFLTQDGNAITRTADGKVFSLKTGTREAFVYLKKTDVDGERVIGIVSDNPPEPVMEALKLFGLWDVINAHAFNVRLWEGPCPKHEMVAEILAKGEFGDISTRNVFWFDDKDYSREAGLIQVNFIQVNSQTNLLQTVRSLDPGNP